jgi:hypothetical protein
VTWHDPKAGAWATVCVLESADAWAGYVGKMSHHISACNSLAPCKCSSGPSPPPGPPPPPHTDTAGCVVKNAALTYSQKALVPPRHADRIAAALDLTGCAKMEGAYDPAQPQPAAVAEQAVGRAGSSFWVDAVKGTDSAAGTSAAAAFKTLHRAQAAARVANGGTVNLMPGGTHYLAQTLTLTPDDSHVTWLGAGEGVVVSGSASFSAACAGKWQKKAGSDAAFSCQLPAGTKFDSLYLNGLRQKKACVQQPPAIPD